MCENIIERISEADKQSHWTRFSFLNYRINEVSSPSKPKDRNDFSVSFSQIWNLGCRLLDLARADFALLAANERTRKL